MKLVQQATFLLIGLAMSSCMQSTYSVNGKAGLQSSPELRSYAFASDGKQDKDWNSVEIAVHKDLRSKNYFYDDVNPEMLVFVKELPKGVKLLSGNTYQEGSMQKLETGKIKTKGKTLLIQMVETQNYQTVWRGFAASQKNNLAMIFQPRIVESVLNQ